MQNFFGIFKRKVKNGYRYVPKIWFKDYQITLGNFDDIEDAARRYDYFASLLYGKGAKLNFPIFTTCECDNCNNDSYKFNKMSQLWMCKEHYILLTSIYNRDIDNSHDFKKHLAKNVYIPFDDYTILELYDGSGKLIKSIKISNQDVEKIKKIKWYVQPAGTPVGNIKLNGHHKTINLGKYILNENYMLKKDGLSVHFKNNNNNDFRHDNLILRTTKQRITQDERCKHISGIYYCKKSNRYVVDKTISGHRYVKKYIKFNDAVKYLNWILIHNNMQSACIKVEKE